MRVINRTKGWLDYLQINAISTLRYNGQPFYFRNINSVGAGAISKFEIQNMNANVEIWDVTNPFGLQKILYKPIVTGKQIGRAHV